MLKPISSIWACFLSNFPSLQRRKMRIRENLYCFVGLTVIFLLDSPRLSGERGSKKKISPFI